MSENDREHFFTCIVNNEDDVDDDNNDDDAILKQAVVQKQNKPRPRIAHCGIARFLRIDQKLITSSHGHSTPSLKISCKSVQPFSRNLANKERKKERKKQTNKQRNQRIKEIDQKQYPVPRSIGDGITIRERTSEADGSRDTNATRRSNASRRSRLSLWSRLSEVSRCSDSSAVTHITRLTSWSGWTWLTSGTLWTRRPGYARLSNSACYTRGTCQQNQRNMERTVRTMTLTADE